MVILDLDSLQLKGNILFKSNSQKAVNLIVMSNLSNLDILQTH